VGAVSTRKQTNQRLDNLEKRLLELKRKLADVLERVTDLQNELFPNKVYKANQFL
jgi:phage shock protein A